MTRGGARAESERRHKRATGAGRPESRGGRRRDGVTIRVSHETAVALDEVIASYEDGYSSRADLVTDLAAIVAQLRRTQDAVRRLAELGGDEGREIAAAVLPSRQAAYALRRRGDQPDGASVRAVADVLDRDTAIARGRPRRRRGERRAGAVSVRRRVPRGTRVT